MVEALLTVAERIRAALNTRRDLILETVAIRHQLGVLARSDRRFRPGDRVLWLCLRWWWHRWKEALVLVEPATVSRWHRQGFAGCWRRRSRRRPGRRRIDSDVQCLIRRMATSNRLWGAPRIHGELLKLGITVSERTVSRYMPDRMKAPSQSWRTFLANHFGELAFASTATLSDAPGDHDVADAYDCRFAPLGVHATGGRTAGRWASVDSPPSRQRPLFGRHVAEDHPHYRTRPRPTGKDPPESGAVELGPNACGWKCLSSGESLSNYERTSGRRPFDHSALHRYRQSLPNHVVNIAWGRSAFALHVKHTSVSDSRGGRNIGDAQGLSFYTSVPLGNPDAPTETRTSLDVRVSRAVGRMLMSQTAWPFTIAPSGISPCST